MVVPPFFRRWRLMTEAGLRMDACAGLGDVLEVLRVHARAIMEADGITVIRREGDEVAYVGEDALAPLWTGLRFPVSACVSGLAILERRPIAIEDISVDPRVPMAAYLSTFVRSMAVFPVGTGNPVAALGCYWAKVQPIDRAAMALVEGLTKAANAALERLAVERELVDSRAGVLVAR
jgi:GAF domain-containing protein